MDEIPIERLRENLRVFEQMAIELEQRAGKIPNDQKRARMNRRLAEIQEYVIQLKGRISASGTGSGIRRTADWPYRAQTVQRNFVELWSEIISGGQ